MSLEMSKLRGCLRKSWDIVVVLRAWNYVTVTYVTEILYVIDLAKF